MSEQNLIREDIAEYLARHEQKTLLRLVIVGSVDDGKSTLIGRLLYDTQNIYDDQLDAIRKASKLPDGSVDLSLLTDGLSAEREQGITIDVAYRYFSTEARKYIVADTPGHVQYTRNMVTGASTAEVAVILIDARYGVLEQSRRHAYLASLLGIPRLLVTVNKMDLVAYATQAFAKIQQEFEIFLRPLRFVDVTFIPASAYAGDNVVSRSERMPWYQGKTVLAYLEEVPVATEQDDRPLRYAVQYVNRPNLDYRGFCGQVVSGTIKRGDPVMVLPSGKTTHVKAIDTFEGELETAYPPLSVTLRLQDEVDCSRGDMIVHPEVRPTVARSFEVDLVWMHERPLDLEKTYLIKHTTQTVRVQVSAVVSKLDLQTLEQVSTEPSLAIALNDIARVRLTCHRALFVDPYTESRSTGAFILIDSLRNATVAAGMIRGNTGGPQELAHAMLEVRAGSGLAPRSQVSHKERRERMRQDGVLVWLTGLPGSGRWPLAYALERKLFDLGCAAHVLRPSVQTVEEAIAAAEACTEAGLITICAFAAPSRSVREQVRTRVGGDQWIEVFVNTSVELCRERRPNARFDDFEPPVQPKLEVNLDRSQLHDSLIAIVEVLEARGTFDDSQRH